MTQIHYEDKRPKGNALPKIWQEINATVFAATQTTTFTESRQIKSLTVLVAKTRNSCSPLLSS